MKKIIGLFFICSLPATFYLLPRYVFAQTTCTYAQNCSYSGLDPSLGQQSCTGTIQGEVCKYDPGVDPNCSECQLIDQVTPTPTITPTPSPSKPGSEEQAVYNLNQGLLPKEVIKDQPQNQDQNFLNQILQGFLDFFTRIINPTKFFAQSETIHQSNIPIQSQESTPGGQIRGFLGGSGGVYGVSLPQEVQSGDIKGSEQAFEKANFPEGVKPITGQ